MATSNGAFGYKAPTSFSPTKRKIFDKNNKPIVGLPTSIDQTIFDEGALPTFLSGQAWTDSHFSGSIMFAVASGSKYALLGVPATPSIISLPATSAWRTCAKNGAVLGVIVENSATLRRSTDSGVTWSTITLPASRDWRSLIAPTAATWAAIAYNSAKMIISTDSGATWTEKNLPTTHNWTNIVGDSTGTNFIVSCSDSNQGYRSIDSGTSWTSITFGTGNNWNIYMNNNGGGQAFAVKYNSNVGAMSTDYGASWTPITLPSTANWIGCSRYSNSATILSDDGKWATSADNGSTWTSIGTFAAGSFVAPAYRGESYSSAAVSSLGYRVDYPGLGAVPVMYGPGITANGSGLAYGNGIFMAACTGRNSLLISSDGKNWSNTADLPVIIGTSMVGYGNGVWVAFDSTGINFYSSDNGATWTQNTTWNAYAWKCIAYGGGQFVVVGYYSSQTYMMTSPNGATWTLRTPSGLSYNTNAIAYSNGYFYIFSSSYPNIYKSPDGILWSTGSTNPMFGSASPYSVVVGKGNYIIGFRSKAISPTTADASFLYRIPTDTTVLNQGQINLPLDVFYQSTQTSTGNTPQLANPIISAIGLITYNTALDLYVLIFNSYGYVFLSRDGLNWMRLNPLYYPTPVAIASGGNVVVALTATTYAVSSNNAEEVVYEK